jgi:hypothetical protein
MVVVCTLRMEVKPSFRWLCCTKKRIMNSGYPATLHVTLPSLFELKFLHLLECAMSPPVNVL